MTDPEGAGNGRSPYDRLMDTPVEEGPVRLAGDLVATATDWQLAAAGVLRKAGRLTQDAPDDAAWSKLTRTTVEGLPIPPLGTPERSAEHRPNASADVNRAGRAIARSESGWDIRSQITDPDSVSAARSAIDDLENGATSLWLTIGGEGTDPAELDSALEGVLLDIAPLILRPAGDVTDLQAAQALSELLDTRGVAPDSGSNLGADPIGRAVRGGPSAQAGFAGIRSISEIACNLGVRGLVVDGTAAHEAGAGDSGELGYALAVGAEYLRELESVGCAVEDAFCLLEFRYAATAEQFTTIAKFRAARWLWRRVAELSGADAGSVGQLSHAVTSLPMLTKYDPWVNLLRTTVAAFAAGVGGADAVTVLPFDTRLGVPDALGRRMARNISSLLIAESHVVAADDPAGGAHAVEILTAELAEAAWAEFQRIERSGGARAALTDGSLRGRWATTSVERHRRIATRRQAITGVSEFPNLREVLPSRRPIDAGASDTFWANPFEELRDEPVSTPVFLATLGSVAEHAARAGFVANLFAAGGIDTVTAGRTSGVSDVLNAFHETKTPVVCLAGSDTAYAEMGADVVSALRSAGAGRVLIAGRPKGGLAELVDDQVAIGDDVVEFLRRTRAHLPETELLAPDLPETGASR